jgi:hypothetical protein
MARRSVEIAERFSSQARDLPGSTLAVTAAKLALEYEEDLRIYQLIQETPSGPMRALKTLHLTAHAPFVIYFTVGPTGTVRMAAILPAEPDGG